MLDALLVELHALRILWQHRVPGTELFDEASVAGRAHVGHNDAVVAPLLVARARKANFQCHMFFLSMMALQTGNRCRKRKRGSPRNMAGDRDVAPGRFATAWDGRFSSAIVAQAGTPFFCETRGTS